jgi:hypothetical protein
MTDGELAVLMQQCSANTSHRVIRERRYWFVTSPPPDGTMADAVFRRIVKGEQDGATRPLPQVSRTL